MRYASKATHSGDAYTDMPAGMPSLKEAKTGKQFNLTAIAWVKLEQERIVEVVEEENALEVLGQLGLVEMVKQ